MPYTTLPRSIKSISPQEYEKIKTRDKIRYRGFGEEKISGIDIVRRKAVESAPVAEIRELAKINDVIELRNPNNNNIEEIKVRTFAKDFENYFYKRGNLYKFARKFFGKIAKEEGIKEKFSTFMKKNSFIPSPEGWQFVEAVEKAYKKGKLTKGERNTALCLERNWDKDAHYDLWWGDRKNAYFGPPIVVQSKKGLKKSGPIEVSQTQGVAVRPGVIPSKKLQSIILKPRSIFGTKAAGIGTEKTFAIIDKAKKNMKKSRRPITNELRRKGFVTAESLAERMNIHPEVAFTILDMNSQKSRLKHRKIKGKDVFYIGERRKKKKRGQLFRLFNKWRV